MTPNQTEVYAMILSEDEKYIFLGGEDEFIYQRSSKDLNICKKYDGLSQTIYSIVLHPLKNYLYAAGSKQRVLQYEINNTENYFEFEAKHDDDIYAMTICGKTNKLISGGKDKRICIWDLERSYCLIVLEKIDLKCDVICALAFNNNEDDRIYFSDNTKNLKYYDFNQNKVEKVESNNKFKIYCFTISKSGKKIATCGHKGELFVIDLHVGKSVKYVGHDDIVNGAVFSKNEKIIYSCSSDMKIIIWNLKKKNIIKVIKYQQSLEQIAISFKENILFTVEDSGALHSIHLKENEIDAENSAFSKSSEYSNQSWEEKDFKDPAVRKTYDKLNKIFEENNDLEYLASICENVNRFDNFKSVQLDRLLYEKFKAKYSSLGLNEIEKKNLFYNFKPSIDRYYQNSEKLICSFFSENLKKMNNFKITDKHRKEFFNEEFIEKKNIKKKTKLSSTSNNNMNEKKKKKNTKPAKKSVNNLKQINIKSLEKSFTNEINQNISNCKKSNQDLKTQFKILDNFQIEKKSKNIIIIDSDDEKKKKIKKTLNRNSAKKSINKIYKK